MEKETNSINENIPPEPKISFRIKFLFWRIDIRRKLSNIKFNWERTGTNFLIFLAFISVISGAIVFVVFMINLSKEYTVTGAKIILDKTGQVGDFIGGVIGSIWALTGVLLFYAALRIQTKELAENRKHFQLSRLTDIIFKQLDLFNSRLSIFELKDIERDENGDHISHQGRSSILLLRHRMDKFLDVENNKELTEEEKQQGRLQYLAESFAFLEINKKEFRNFYEELSNHVRVIRSILIRDEIPPSELNELKAIFFRNVGVDFLNASQHLQLLLDNYIKYKKGRGEEVDLLFSAESSIDRNISSINEFRNLKFSEEILKDYIRSRDSYNSTAY